MNTILRKLLEDSEDFTLGICVIRESDKELVFINETAKHLLHFQDASQLEFLDEVIGSSNIIRVNLPDSGTNLSLIVHKGIVKDDKDSYIISFISDASRLVLIEQELKEHIHILEESKDWYLLYSVVDDNLEIKYRNKAVNSCVIRGSKFCKNCWLFDDLKQNIIEVYNTKEPQFISNYILTCPGTEEKRYFDIQIYRSNGHVVLCARDQTDILTSNVKALRDTDKKLDSIIKKRGRLRVNNESTIEK
jgi:hypothetical protein